MTGNGTACGHVILTFAPRTMAATSPAVERVQANGGALPEGATPAENAEIVRRLIAGHPHGTVHALFRQAPWSCSLCLNTSISLQVADGAVSHSCGVL